MNRKFILSVIAGGLFSATLLGQTPTPTPQVQTTINSGGGSELPKGRDFKSISKPAPQDLQTILTEAEKQIQNYGLTFKDLLATETKTFARYDKEGNAKDQTTVESDFLVYQSPRNENVASELRNVVKVNGKPVPDSQSRSEKFLGELQKASTLESELEKIQKEGARYDKTLEVYGLTLYEGGVLDAELRPFFDFQMAGSETYDGSEVYVINYQQTRKSPFVTLNGSTPESKSNGFDFQLDVPGSLKKSDPLLRGKLWIDKQTYQIRREQRELTVQTDEPLVLLANDFVYQSSEYGILVPKQIVVTTNLLKRDKDTDRYQAVKDSSLSFEYSKFRKTETDVKILDDTN
jgi:hypothetical protein